MITSPFIISDNSKSVVNLSESQKSAIVLILNKNDISFSEFIRNFADEIINEHGGLEAIKDNGELPLDSWIKPLFSKVIKPKRIKFKLQGVDEINLFNEFMKLKEAQAITLGASLSQQSYAVS